MEESNQCCYSCLCTEEEFNLREFTIQCEPLRTLLQVDKICLCYLCNRIAQHVELFIQNVQSNQVLLQNFHGDIASSIQPVRAQVQPTINLTQSNPTTMELTDPADDEELFSIISSKDLKIKLELKEERLVNSEAEFICDSGDFEDPAVKEEDDFPLTALLKQEVELKEIDLTSLRRTLKPKKIKKDDSKLKERIKKKLIELPKFYTKMYISEAQCKQEREQKAQGKAYLHSTYKCEHCILGFVMQEPYTRHMARHALSRGRFRCKICGVRYNTSAKLAKHKQGHTLRYKCPECDMFCAGYRTIKEHFSAKHTSNLGYCELKCPQCPKIFTRELSLQKHKSYRHSGNMKVACAICNNTYANKESLRSHIIRKHPNESELGKRYMCQECGLSFGAPSQLRNHGVKHSDLRAFYCVECDRSFKTSASLAHHLKTASPHINFAELPLQCQHCDKRFSIKRDLVRHTNRIHLNIKPYSCDKCDRTYINSWSLKDHKRYAHDGMKRALRYPCSMCEKIFDRNSILKSHMRTHTGERPYLCSHCPASFAQGSALGTHVKLIHLQLTRNGRPKHSTRDAATDCVSDQCLE